MNNNKKQVVFTNEIIYERNISDRIWPSFLEAVANKKIEDAWMALKCYYLFTQQWYRDSSESIGKNIRMINTNIGKARTVKEASQKQKDQYNAWIEIEKQWCDISNKLEDYGLFKRNFTHDNDALALPTGRR
jgi:hypothetical protein